jgi:hypothetical protein
MAEVVRSRLTLKKIRTALFIRSYAIYRISEYLTKKYKIDKKLKPCKESLE